MIRKVEMADFEVLAKIAKQTFRETFAHDNTEAVSYTHLTLPTILLV